METATPGVKSTPDGWLNRYLHAREHEAQTPFRAVALASQLPRALQGVAPALAIGQIDRFGIRAGQSTRWCRRRSSPRTRRPPIACCTRPGARPSTHVRMLKQADPTRYAPSNGAEYPRSAYGEALKQIAQLVKSDVGLEVAFAESGNWDHHVNEGAALGQLATRLDDFGRGIAALVRDLGDRMQDVVILTMSEFGRAVAENGNRGTDHGHGNAMLILGGSGTRREGVRKMARPGARATIRRPRSRRDDRLPCRLQRGRASTPGTHQHAGRVPRLHRTRTARPLLTRERPRTCRGEPAVKNPPE